MISVVIGSNFGDEGKGLITDHLASKYNHDCTVIRFNGGSQAGHTVKFKDHRHVFSHFPSGAFRGTNLHLSRNFVVNPTIFLQEYEELSDKVGNFKITCDPRAIITTPYDMIINRIISQKNKHGTCGLGINETVERNKIPWYSFRIKDITKPDIENIIPIIKEEYIPYRLETLEICKHDISKTQKEILYGNWVQDKILNEMKKISTYLSCITDNDIINSRENIIFEGAQGLLLDELNGTFPYVTRSRTGLDNICELLKGHNREIDVYFITRSYLTRHGYGPISPFGNEIDRPEKIIDETNTWNGFQGHLRFASFNIDELRNRINNEIKKAKKNKLKINPKLIITCLDQTNGKILTDFGEIYPEQLKYLDIDIYECYDSYGRSIIKISDPRLKSWA